MLIPLLLLFLAGGIDAFAYSCEEVRYKLMNSKFEHDTEYACVFVQEGFSNWKQLNMIHLAGVSESMQDIASQRCLSRGAQEDKWKLTADSKLTLKCDQQFTVVFSSELPNFWTPLKQIRQAPVLAASVPLQTFVVPQTEMWFRTKSCTGNGNVTFWTGAGIVEDERRFALQSWTCEFIPSVVYSFDSVVTITAEGDVEYYVDHSSNMGSSSKPPIDSVRHGDHIAVLTSGRSDDIQNRKGLNDARAYIKIDAKRDVSVQMEIILDPVNTGSVQLQKSKGFKVYDYYTGLSQEEQFKTDYFEVRYEPSALQPQQIWNSRDNVVIEAWIGVPPPTPSAPTTTSTTTTVAPTTTPTPATTAAPTTTSTTTTVAPTTTPTPACQTCSQDLVNIVFDSVGDHEFQTDVTAVMGDCSVRMLTCAGINANIEINNSGVLTSADNSVDIALTCNQDGTAWTYADVPITQLECASM